ncbi:hypothetical protein BD408DRAFT_438053 [Parasitella parasitica]|nr:hypothetical protein BD408DRAFT_438053 [Parasitella parasitica]
MFVEPILKLILKGHQEFTFEYCDHQPILKTLTLMQMLPSSTELPKIAIHFAVFEKLASLKLNGYLSNYAFVKSQNSDNHFLCNFDTTKFKFLNNGLFNSMQILYRNIKAHALNDLFYPKDAMQVKNFNCHACDGDERVGVVLDGNFQLKRKNNTNISEHTDKYPSIFAISSDVEKLWGTKEEVEAYALEKESSKEEVSISTNNSAALDELENSFKASSNALGKTGDRFDEEGVFSVNCARHGMPIRLYDIFESEGRKYALAAINHILQQLNNKQKLLIMYDIICLCKNKLEEKILGLKARDPIYLVIVSHAYAHSMHCQVMHHPKVIEGSGNTDGEGVEKFWSTANRFIAMTRQMSKSNRKALLTDVVAHFKRNKMIDLSSQIAKKYNKAVDKIREYNIINAEYSKLEKKWKEHVALVKIPATPAGINELIKQVESQKAYDRQLTYLRLNARYFQLDQEMKDENQRNVSNWRVLTENNMLVKQINELKTKFGFKSISSLNDPAFQEHRDSIIKVRYEAMADFLKHLIFANLMKEHRLAQPGSSGILQA